MLRTANSVAVSCELPEALRVVDWSVGNAARELGVVDEAKIVGAGSVVLEGDGKDRAGEGALYVVEPCVLCLGLDGVDA